MNQRFDDKYPHGQHLDFVELLHDMESELRAKGGSALFDQLFSVEFSESCSCCGAVREMRSSLYLRLQTENGWKLSTPLEPTVLGLGMEFCAQPCTDQLSTPHYMEFRHLPVVLIVEPINQFEVDANVCSVCTYEKSRCLSRESVCARLQAQHDSRTWHDTNGCTGT
jgi:hypothetical protein